MDIVLRLVAWSLLCLVGQASAYDYTGNTTSELPNGSVRVGPVAGGVLTNCQNAGLPNYTRNCVADGRYVATSFGSSATTDGICSGQVGPGTCTVVRCTGGTYIGPALTPPAQPTPQCPDPGFGRNVFSAQWQPGVQGQAVCSVNSSQSADKSRCICNAGFRNEGGSTACTAYTCPAGGAGLPGTYAKLAGAGGSFCLNGCRAVAALQYQEGGTGAWYAKGPFTSVGATCEQGISNDTNAVAPPEDAASGPQPLEPGKCPGTVNGMPVVVDCGTKSSTRVDISPDGTRTETTTSCRDGNCTTTTKTTSPSGVVTQGGTSIGGTGGRTDDGTVGGTGGGGGTSGDSSGDSKEDEASFCEENAESPICKSSSFGGACGAYTCDGDAVQCAIAREQYERNCKLFDTETALSTKGGEIANGQVQPEGHPGLVAVASDISFGTAIDKTDIVGGSCPGDVNVTVSPGMPPVVLPFASMCGPAGILGNVLVGITALACLFIVFGTKRS